MGSKNINDLRKRLATMLDKEKKREMPRAELYMKDRLVGMSYSAIAKKHGVSYQAVRKACARYCKRMGIDTDVLTSRQKVTAKEYLLTAAKELKEHCKKHNFFNDKGICTCVFTEVGETCPFEAGSGIPEDWEV